MKKNILLILIFCGLITGITAQEQKTISRFEGKTITGVEISGAFNVTIRQGKPTGASVTIPAQFEEQLIFTLNDNGILKIHIDDHKERKKSYRQRQKYNHFTAEIVCSSLEKIALTGACKLQAIGEFTPDKLWMKLTGASMIQIAGKIQVEKNMKVSLSGASKFYGAITATTAFIDLTGATELTITGNAGQCQMNASGASKANMLDFLTKEVDVDVSGASKVNLNVLEEIRMKVSGASKVTYKGNPKVSSTSISEASSVKKIDKK